jgi:hypothetical protein
MDHAALKSWFHWAHWTLLILPLTYWFTRCISDLRAAHACIFSHRLATMLGLAFLAVGFNRYTIIVIAMYSLLGFSLIA